MMLQAQQQVLMMRPPALKLPPSGRAMLRVAVSPRAPSLSFSPRCLCSSSEDPDSSSAPLPPPPAKPSPWLFVGIGNPGKKYEGTRHNVGFEMIDTIAREEGISLSTIQFKALLGKGKIGDAPVLLAKPQTYMNLSGEAVRPLATYYKIPPERILTFYDDLDLEFAVMRLLPKGGHGGHNGMRSIIEALRNRNTPRLRIGIGRPPGQMDPKAFVLQKFSASEREELDYALERALEAIRLVTTAGLEKAVSTWNQVRKSKMARMHYSSLEVD